MGDSHLNFRFGTDLVLSGGNTDTCVHLYSLAQGQLSFSHEVNTHPLSSKAVVPAVLFSTSSTDSHDLHARSLTHSPTHPPTHPLNDVCAGS